METKRKHTISLIELETRVGGRNLKHVCCIELILAAPRRQKPSPASNKTSILCSRTISLQPAKYCIATCDTWTFQTYSWYPQWTFSNTTTYFPSANETISFFPNSSSSIFGILIQWPWFPCFFIIFLQSFPLSPLSNLNLEFTFYVKLEFPHFKNLRT